MTDFIIILNDKRSIKFKCYFDAAPATARAFLDAIPFLRVFFHARVSGYEIWNDTAPRLNIPQENSSVYAQPGEIVIGPVNPVRNKVAGLMGIFYGEGKLVDGGNIFGKVIEEDLPKLIKLGEEIWKGGAQELKFEKC